MDGDLDLFFDNLLFLAFGVIVSSLITAFASDSSLGQCNLSALPNLTSEIVLLSMLVGRSGDFRCDELICALLLSMALC